MMKDLKLGFQVLKYEYGRKGMSTGAVVILLLAFPMCAFSMLKVINLPGGYCFLMGAFCLCQLSSLYTSDLVMASPARKRLEISVYPMMQFTASAISYLLVLVIGGIVAVCSPEHIRNVCSQLILTAVFTAITLLYSAVCRKYYIASTIVFFLIFVLRPDDMKWWLPSPEDGWGLFAGAALKGMALILCGGGLLYLINLALYKAPMSRLHRTTSLRRSL